MATYKTIILDSQDTIDFIDITHIVRDYVVQSGVDDGAVLVYTPHTTAGVTINENADPSVLGDISHFLTSKIPHEKVYKHMEGNSPAHIMSSLFSASETIIIHNGNLVLGTWQGIFFCEFDGPRHRKVHVKILLDN